MGKGFGPAYDATRETTLVGTIQQVALNHATDKPAGVHLMIAGPQGTEDACIGPFLSQQTKAAVQAGVSVRLIGSTIRLHGKEYFLVRELVVGGNSIVIRTQRGFLVDQRENQAASMHENATFEVKGGQR